jgi:hypothetical protein
VRARGLQAVVGRVPSRGDPPTGYLRNQALADVPPCPKCLGLPKTLQNAHREGTVGIRWGHGQYPEDATPKCSFLTTSLPRRGRHYPRFGAIRSPLPRPSRSPDRLTAGFEVALVWLEGRMSVALVWLWCGLGVALGWLCTPEYMASICLLYGFAMALGGFAASGTALARPRRRPAKVMKAPQGSQPAAIMPRKQGHASKLAQMARQFVRYDHTIVW